MISFTHTRSLARSLSPANAHASTYLVTYKIYTGTTPILIKPFFSIELNGWKFCTGCQNGSTRGSAPCSRVVTYPNGAVRSDASPSVSAPTAGPRPSCVRARGHPTRVLRDGRNYEEMMKPSVRRGPGMERSAAPRANGRVYTDNDCVNRRLASSMFSFRRRPRMRPVYNKLCHIVILTLQMPHGVLFGFSPSSSSLRSSAPLLPFS